MIYCRCCNIEETDFTYSGVLLYAVLLVSMLQDNYFRFPCKITLDNMKHIGIILKFDFFSIK